MPSCQWQLCRCGKKRLLKTETLFKYFSLQNAESPETICHHEDCYARFLVYQGRKDEASRLDARATAAQNANAQSAALATGVYHI